MPRDDWKAAGEVLKLFRAVGRASLLLDIQDSHSGNMAVKLRGEDGRETIAVTSAGSQKGDLEADNICFLPVGETDFGYYKASSETDVHARVLSLEGVGASMHAHAKDLAIATLDDDPKPGNPRPFAPVDPLGRHHLGAEIPVDWVEVPSGSREMADRVFDRLSRGPAAVIQAHGVFTRGRTLQEAFFHACLANNSGFIARLLERLRVDVGSLRARATADPAGCFGPRPAAYEPGGDERCEFPEEEELVREFRKTGARIFESRLSPFHTGSISVRGVSSLLYAPKGSMPRELGGPLLKVPHEPDPRDSDELARHKAVYALSDFQTLLHCYVPEAEAQAQFVPPGAERPLDRITAIDAEGGFLYLVVPVAPLNTGTEELVRLLFDYKVVVVRGGGVWAAGHQSLSEVLHHPSSVREICLYRIGAFERGLDLGRMEPEKAKRW
jgi:ribulose-5-phosphate 4-epimerase/fuculose-1-phosphate aldolase